MAELRSCSSAASLQIEIDRRNQILTGLRRNRFDLVLNAAATVDDHFPIAVSAAQVVVVSLFETALTDDVARFQSFVFVSMLLQLLRTDLADVTEHVRQQAVGG